MPHWLTRFLLRARATLSRWHDRELRDEMQFHLNLLQEEYTAQGNDRDTARRLAHQDFGNPVRFQEASHDLFSFRLLEDLQQDLRFALREIRRTPGFTCIATMSLTLGIGSVTSIFAVVDALMFRPLPVRDPSQLVALSTGDRPAWTSWPYALYTRLRDSPDQLLDVAAAAAPTAREVVATDSGPRGDIRVSLVSASYFDVVGADLPLGRTFSNSDDTAGAPPVAIISDALWRRWFDRAPDVLSKTIAIQGIEHDIVGVTPRTFGGHVVNGPPDIWIPLAMQSLLTPAATGLLDSRAAAGARWLTIVGRLKPGTTVEQAAVPARLARHRLLADKAAELGEHNPDVARERKEGLVLVRAATGHAPERALYARPLGILSGITILVLLVACANFTNLMLVRSESRQHEFVIRLALGGGRWRLVRQAAIECAVISISAGVLALLFAKWATMAALVRLGEMIVPLDFTVHFDARVLGFAAACVAVGVAFALWPCARAARAAVGTSLHETARVHGRGRQHTITGRLTLVSQLAICAILLIAAGLLFRTVANLRSQELGFDRNALLVTVSPAKAGYSEATAALLLQRIRERLSAVPGVEAVGMSGAKLLDFTNYWVDGSQMLTTDRGAVLPGAKWTFAAVGPGFFDAVGTPVIDGRTFDDRDAQASAHVAVINRSLAQFLFGDVHAVGRRIRMNPRAEPLAVIGVVADVKQLSPRERGTGLIYLPLRHFGEVVLAVRTTGTPADAAPVIRHQLAAIDGHLPIDKIHTIGDALDGAIAQERFMSTVASMLAALAVALGCIGLYALMSYEVVRRRHELGIRLALGATSGRIVRMVLQHSALLIVPALAVGLPLGVGVSRSLTSQLYGVEATDPWTLVFVSAVLGLVALVATFKPARAAARIDPIALVRSE